MALGLAFLSLGCGQTSQDDVLDDARCRAFLR